MNDQELRALVREALVRHGGIVSEPVTRPVAGMVRLHPSHGIFVMPSGADTDGPCLIEPAVMCNHCGYCKSYGH